MEKGSGERLRLLASHTICGDSCHLVKSILLAGAQHDLPREVFLVRCSSPMSSSPSSTSASRTLVLCFDGTAKKYGEKVTNVVRLFRALEKNRLDHQVCYYQPGIGKGASRILVPYANELV